MPRTASTADEDAFMASLLEGIDASAFDAPPSSQGSASRSPVKSSRSPVRSPAKCTRSPSKSLAPLRSVSGHSKPAPAVDASRPSQRAPTTPLPASGTQKRKGDLLDFLGLAPAKRVAAESQRSPPGTARSGRELNEARASARDSARATATFSAFNARKREQTPPPPSSQDVDYDADWDLDALAVMDESALLGGMEVSKRVYCADV